MAMNKLLYVLPALAILGLIPAADADKTQERIERLQERIVDLQERIEQSTDQKKIAKWEANIDRLQNRIAELEARQAKAAQSATPPQEPASARQEREDTTPPSVVSAELSADLATLTITFDEEVRRDSSTSVVFIDGLSSVSLSVSTSATSETFAIGVPAGVRHLIGDNPSLRILDDTFRDTAGNGNARTNMPITIPDTTPPSFVSATLDMSDGTLTVVFDEVIDFSKVKPAQWLLANINDVRDRQFLGDSQFDSTASNSETVTLTVGQAVLDWVGDKSLAVLAETVNDPAGNHYDTPSNGEPLNVIPADTTPPVITLVGDNPLAHELGEPYTDPGADADDGSPVTVDASAVDVDVAGDYTVTYTATDSNGNEGTATRTVQVRDTAGPAVVSATFDVTADTLTIVFDKTIDLSEVHLEEIGLGRHTLAGTTFDAAAPDSDTLVLDGHWSTAGNVLGLENPELAFGRNSVRDTDGNGIRAVTVPVALANVPVPDATVTITAGGMFAEDAGTIDLQQGGDMTIEVRFVNGHASDHTVLADLISWNFGHQSEDIEIRSGQSETVTFTVQNEAPRIEDNPGRANVYLVFGVADIPGTPVYEPDEILGDRAIKVRIAEPAN